MDETDIEELTVHQAINAVRRIVGNIGKNAKASKYSYRGIEAVVNGIAPAMHDVGLIIVGRVVGLEHAPMIGREAWSMTQMTVEYTVMGPAGDVLTDGNGKLPSAVGFGADNDDKGPGKARSYAYKTFVGELLLIPTDANLDNEAAPVYVQPPPPPVIDKAQHDKLLALFRTIDDADTGKEAWSQWTASLPLKPALMLAKDYEAMWSSATQTVSFFRDETTDSNPIDFLESNS